MAQLRKIALPFDEFRVFKFARWCVTRISDIQGGIYFVASLRICLLSSNLDPGIEVSGHTSPKETTDTKVLS